MQDKPVIVIIGSGRTGRILMQKLKDSWSLVVIDKNPEKIKISQKLAKSNDINFIEADATSAVVLERANIAAAFHVLIMINDDVSTAEISRILINRFQKKNIIARASSESYAIKLKGIGVNVITPFETAANLVLNQINLGEIIALNIGKGEGEIVQLELTKSSPLIGKKLRELPPKQWIIGAIYRPKNKIVRKSTTSYLKGFQISKEDELIIPDGNTIPHAGDKLILIGDPHILRPTAQYLKAGAPVFPLRHGDHLLVVYPSDKNNTVSGSELQWLINTIEPVRLNFIYSRDEQMNYLKSITYPDFWPERITENIQYKKKSFWKLNSLVREMIRGFEVGLVIVRKSSGKFFGFVESNWLLPSLLKAARDKSTPVWVIKNNKPIKKINLFVSSHSDSLRATELAIDAAKKFNIPLKAIQVTPPSILTGDALLKQADETMRSIHEIAGLYGIVVEESRFSGNPVFETLKNLNNDELLALPYPVNDRPGFLMPPIPEKLLFKKCKGSILVLPV